MNPDTIKWPSPRKFALAYAIAIFALILNAAYAFWNLRTIQTIWDTIGSSREFARTIDRVVSDLKDAEAGQRSFLLTGDPRYLELFTRSRGGILPEINRLREASVPQISQKAHLDALSEAIAAELDELEKGIGIRNRDGLDAAVLHARTGGGLQAMQRVRGELATMQAQEDALQGPLRRQLQTGNPTALWPFEPPANPAPAQTVDLQPTNSAPFWPFERAASQGATVRRDLQTAITRMMVTFTLASALALALLFGVHSLSDRSRNQLRSYATWLSTTLRSIGDGVIATDNAGRVIFMNEVAENLTGWAQDDARGKPLEEVFCITNESGVAVVESPVKRVLRDGSSEGLPDHTILKAKNGIAHPIEDMRRAN